MPALTVLYDVHMSLVEYKFNGNVFYITLKDEEKRNALGIAMFDAIDDAISNITSDVRCVVLTGNGPSFCAGFDMKACVHDLSVLDTYILKLSSLLRVLRRLPMPVVVAAHGAAIAGGCALLTGGDFVVGSFNGKYGYPVHQLGISPAVTIPTLFQRLGEGRARSLVLSGELLEGADAFHIGLLTHLEVTNEDVAIRAIKLATSLATKPPHALRATKHWFNELDGSLNDERFDLPAVDSSESIGDETQSMLHQLWKK